MTKLSLAKSNLAVAYFGSPDFSANFLEKLVTDNSMLRNIEVKLVVTQPDRKVGRKQILTPTPVKLVAKRHQIPIFEYKSEILNPKSQINSKSQTLNSKRFEFRDSDLFGTSNLGFRILREIDLALVYAFAHKIPTELLNLPKYGFWNIHPSLLPKYRGPSPIAYPLIDGDKETGVTIIKMDDQIDHGPIIAQEKLKILSTDKRPDLEEKLTDLAFEMLKKIITSFVRSYNTRTISFTNQNHKLATYTRLLKKSDGFIPLEVLEKAISNQQLTINDLPAITKEYYLRNNLPPNTYLLTPNFCILNLFRAFSPWPGLWTTIRVHPRLDPRSSAPTPIQKRLKLTQLTINNSQLTISRVQLEGKRDVDFETFQNAYKVF